MEIQQTKNYVPFQNIVTRVLSNSKIEKIIKWTEGFNMPIPPNNCFRKEGLYYIIDGQHRNKQANRKS
jgi:hypothetical protein